MGITSKVMQYIVHGWFAGFKNRKPYLHCFDRVAQIGISSTTLQRAGCLLRHDICRDSVGDVPAARLSQLLPFAV